MRKLQIVGLVFAAVFAFSVIVASSAFAESEWLFNTEKVTAELPVESSGEITLSDDSTGTEILCSGVFVGIVKEKTDTITEVLNASLVKEEATNLAGAKVSAISCAFTKAGLCSASVGQLVSVIPINLAWKTEIVLDEGIFIDLIQNAGKGLPGYEISCSTLIGTQTDTCTGEPGSVLTNSVTDVTAEFRNEELTNPAGKCSIGGEKEGLIVSDNAGLIADNPPGTLAVS